MFFLEDFWKGRIAPGEERYRPNKEYSNPMQVMEQCEVHLHTSLKPEDWAMFQKYIQAEQAIKSLSECDNFMDGFRYGAKMMMDVLSTPCPSSIVQD